MYKQEDENGSAAQRSHLSVTMQRSQRSTVDLRPKNIRSFHKLLPNKLCQISQKYLILTKTKGRN